MNKWSAKEITIQTKIIPTEYKLLFLCALTFTILELFFSCFDYIIKVDIFIAGQVNLIRTFPELVRFFSTFAQKFCAFDLTERKREVKAEEKKVQTFITYS